MAIDLVKIVKLNSPFDSSTREFSVANWAAALTVADYLSDIDWPAKIVSVDGQILSEAEQAEKTLKPTDSITVCYNPLGGGEDSGKSVLRVVAFFALSYATGGVGGFVTNATGSALVGAVAQFGVMYAGSMLINAALPIPDYSLKEIADGPSYGIDGAKNTASEGVPTPITYGTFKTAGNIVQFATVNDGTKNQDVNVLICAGEAPITGIVDVEVNDQPIENYDGWSYAVKTKPEPRINPSNWNKIYASEVGEIASGTGEAKSLAPFLDGSYTPYSRQVTLTDDPFGATPDYTTTTTVDGLRLDFVAPAGLLQIQTLSNKKGPEYTSVKVDVDVQIREQGTSTWRQFKADLIAANDISYVYDYNYSITAHSATPSSLGGPSRSLNEALTGPEYEFDHVVWDASGKTGRIDRYIPSFTYYPAGSNTSNTSDARSTGIQTFIGVGQVRSGSFTTGSKIFFSGRSRNPLRFSLMDTSLDDKVYELRARRKTPQVAGTGVDVSTQDEIVWTDVNEIETERIGFNGSAMLAVKIRLSDQLTSIPKITYTVQGMSIPVWVGDLATGGWQEQFSANPAWITHHMLTSDLGARQDPSRIDFYAWYEWAEYCDSKNYEFNGIFDANINIWDAMQPVLRAGHAQIVPAGIRWTVAVEKPADPVMVFGNTNIVKDSLSVNWLPMEERANEIELTYYDREDGFNRNTIRRYNNFFKGDKPRPAAFTMIGVTDRAIAEKEANLHLNLNRFIRQSASFEATLDSLAVIPGDVITLQNDYPQWGYSGMVERSDWGLSKNVINLGSEVAIDTGVHVLSIHYPTVKYTHVITAKEINNISVTPDFSPKLEVGNKAISLNGNENTILAIEDDRLFFGGTVNFEVGDEVELLAVNQSVESIINNPVGNTNSVTCNNFFQEIPQYAKWLLGKQNIVGKPFRVSGIELGSNAYTRKINCLEYDENVFSDTISDALPINYSQINKNIGHVKILYLDRGPFNTIETLRLKYPKPTGSRPWGALGGNLFGVFNYAIDDWEVITLVAGQPFRLDENDQVTALEQLDVIDGLLSSTVKLKWDEPEIGVYDGADIYYALNGGSFEHLATVRGNSKTYETNIFSAGDNIDFKIVAINDLGIKAPYSSAPIVSIYLNSSPAFTGDVNLPEEMHRGGFGDVCFVKHNPSTIVTQPVISQPVLKIYSAKVIEIRGGKFYHPDGNTRYLTASTDPMTDSFKVLDTPFIGDFTFRPFYIIFSDIDVKQRFPASFNYGQTNQFQIFVAAYREREGKWQAIDASGELHDYQPLITDCLLGRGSKVSTLGGIDILASFISVNKELPDDAAKNIKTFTQENAPSNPRDKLVDGDMWIQTGLIGGNLMHIFNGTVWIRYRDAGISAALAAAAEFESKQDGKTVCYFSDTQPPAAGVLANDYWFKTNDNNAAHIFNGNSFVPVTGNQLAKAILLGATPAGISDGKLTMFYAAVKPKAAAVGDLWYSTATKNVSRWTASKWVIISQVGTHWDDVNGDGLPDSYVGNTGSQLLADFNFERSAALAAGTLGGRRTWQGLTTVGPPNRQAPYDYETTDKITFDPNIGENGSAGVTLSGGGVSNFVNMFSPQMFSAHAGDTFISKMRVKTFQPGVVGNNGLAVMMTYYNSNFQIIGTSDLNSNVYGPVFNPSTNNEWHIQNTIIEIPKTLNNVAWASFAVVFKSTVFSKAHISRVELTKERFFTHIVDLPGSSTFNDTFYIFPNNFNLVEAYISTLDVDIEAGEQIDVTCNFSLKHSGLNFGTTFAQMRVALYATPKSQAVWSSIGPNNTDIVGTIQNIQAATLGADSFANANGAISFVPEKAIRNLRVSVSYVNPSAINPSGSFTTRDLNIKYTTGGTRRSGYE